MKYFEPAERLVNVLKNKTQNKNSLFFRVLVAYTFSKAASMMRVDIKTHDRGNIPVSLYCINLSTSGTGKGHSMNIIEEQVLNKFKERFLEETLPTIATKNLARLALKRSIASGEKEEDEMMRVQKEYDDLGELAFSFDGGTTPAVKQMRHKMLMAEAGSINLEIDEIGSNLSGNLEVLNSFLELFDVGKIKQKLIKNTSENKRNKEIDGRTPTNMMLFGTPSKLLNGGKEEAEFYALLETGYARRCVFGYHKKPKTDINMTEHELYDMLTDKKSLDYVKDLSNKLGRLADPMNFGQTLAMSKDVSLQLLRYKINCDILSDEMKEHEDMARAEMTHRYYKALKLAGAYAFIDGSHEVTEDHLHCAIKLVEESGNAFAKILTRERNYVKLAKYLANIGREVTAVDLVEDLPFYRGAEAQKRELMSLAIAYGYKNNIIIKKSYDQNIEFFTGESMEVTDLNKMRISYSQAITEGYRAEYAPFDQLHKLTSAANHHYTAHHWLDGYRNRTNLLQGFNMVILDIDKNINLQTAQTLLSDYKCLFATTKRHTDANNRFRIIMPMTHTVKLDAEGYAKFMENVFNWLPFEVDAQTKDVARKWETFPGNHIYQEGALLDATLFIPQTRKEEEQSQKVLDNNALTNIERWFHLNTDKGNRSNQLIRYALVLVDNGQAIETIRQAVLSFNSKLKESLSEDEINNTIMITVIKAVTTRDMKAKQVVV